MDVLDKKTKKYEHFSISYTIEVFVNSSSDKSIKQRLIKKHEFEVREYLFTDTEIAKDVEMQKTANQVKELFKTGEVLKPMFEHTKASTVNGMFTSNQNMN